MPLTKERIEEIEGITWDLIWDHYQNENIVPPINVRNISNSIGLTTKFGRFQIVKN